MTLAVPREVLTASPGAESPSFRVWMTKVSQQAPNALTRGSATITVGNTSVTVTHGLGTTPTYVLATPTADPGGRFWVSAKGATTFVINVSTAAGGSLTFDWRAEAA